MAPFGRRFKTASDPAEDKSGHRAKDGPFGEQAQEGVLSGSVKALEDVTNGKEGFDRHIAFRRAQPGVRHLHNQQSADQARDCLLCFRKSLPDGLEILALPRETVD